MQELHISANEAGQRLDKLLAKYLREAPKSFIYKMLRKKNITLNGKKCSGQEKLTQGDIVKLFLSDETIRKFSGQDLVRNPNQKSVHKTGYNAVTEADLKKYLQIIYEDENILLLNKPAGLLSQKAKPEDISAVEILTKYLISSGQITEQELRTFHPAVCNRLDRNTSGLLAAGKSLGGLQELSRFFKDRSIEKYYLCLVKGSVTNSARIQGYLYKDEKTNKVRVSETKIAQGTEIDTEYRPLACGEGLSLLEVHLITGKTHQIRAHMASIGHPIVGDYKYGNKKLNEKYRQTYGVTSQLLHAYRLVMPENDGVLGYLAGKEFKAPPPAVFRTTGKGAAAWVHGIQED